MHTPESSQVHVGLAELLHASRALYCEHKIYFFIHIFVVLSQIQYLPDCVHMLESVSNEHYSKYLLFKN